jgi:nucleotide sugar dehydrogenase
MNDVSLVGIGKLGICFGLTLEKNGYNVLGVDLNQEYVNSINNKTYKSLEENVELLLTKSVNLRATTSLKEAVEFSDTIFLLVATPSLENGRYDHSQVDNVVEHLEAFGTQDKRKDLIICCTTMPGYCDSVQERLRKYNYFVSYNPEFIAQGTILRNQERPDMVLIGSADEYAAEKLCNIYKKHTLNNPEIHVMSRTEAELCKISLNCFLTTKISFANMIGDIATRVECRPDVILKAIGSDSRIGNKYLSYGFGFGGPCFPRDNRALSIYADDVGIDALISKSSDASNKLHLEYQIQEFIKNNRKDKLVIFDTVTYKKDSILLTESQQLKFALRLSEEGYDILIKERREVIDVLTKMYGDRFKYERKNS